MAHSQIPAPPDSARPATCNCALLCDDVLQSHIKGKHTLVGIIGAIVTPSVPTAFGPCMCYVRLANLVTAKTIVVSLEHADSAEEVLSFQVDVPEQDHPLGVCTIVAPLPPMALDKAGPYLFSVKSDGFLLAQSPIAVILIPGSGTS
jgi:hypothetical protein